MSDVRSLSLTVADRTYHLPAWNPKADETCERTLEVPDVVVNQLRIWRAQNGDSP